ncbi:MAG: hypothetical protein ACYCSG_04800 [Thermoplasmataceae archaeon]
MPLPFSDLDLLNRRLKFSFNSGVEIAKMSAEFDTPIEVGIFIGSDYSDRDIFIPDKKEFTPGVEFFLRKYHGERRGNFWLVRRNMEGAELKNFQDIMSIPSMVLNGITLYHGVYEADFLFNEGNDRAVSSLILDICSQSDTIHIDYLGDSQSYIKTIKSKDKTKNLYVAEIDHDIPEEEIKSELEWFGGNWIRIIKNPYGNESLNSIYFVNSKPLNDRNVTCIKEGKLYQKITENAFVRSMNLLGNKSRIITQSRIQMLDGTHYKAIVFIPQMFINEWLNVWKSSVKELKSWNPVLSFFSDFKSWLEHVEKEN